MSGEPILALLMGGLDFDEFSTSPGSTLLNKKLIRSVKYSDAKALVQKALTLSTGREVEELSLSKLREWAPHILGDK